MYTARVVRVCDFIVLLNETLDELLLVYLTSASQITFFVPKNKPQHSTKFDIIITNSMKIINN